MATGRPPHVDKTGWFKSDVQRAAVITGILGLITALLAVFVTALVTRNNVLQSVTRGGSSAPTISSSIVPAPSPHDSSSAPANPGGTPTPTYIQASPSLPPGGSIPPNEYTVGMCFHFSGSGSFDSISYQPCSSPHNGQMIALFNASGSPSIQAADNIMGTACGNIVSGLPKSPNVQYRSYLQFPGDYTTGNRAFECFALSDQDTTTSLIAW
jgi:hypothetical protein